MWKNFLLGKISTPQKQQVKTMEYDNHIKMLGMKAVDAVTGFSGVVTTLSFDLYGCVQAVVTPPVNDKGETKDGQWFDVTRLKVSGDGPVMQRPDFSKGYIAQGRKGCASKSLP